MTAILPLERRGIPASRLVLGCMGLGGGWNSDPVTDEHYKQASETMEAALASGITMFDHADIYTMGKAEMVFGNALREHTGLRESIILQSKCGIRFSDGPDKPHRFDFSSEHILSSVDGILSRLKTDYLDILLLHRPDPLMEPEEVADAFEKLIAAGKVRHFGVSNMGAGQIRLLQSACTVPLIVNQLELNLAHTDWIDQGVHINQHAGKDQIFPEGTLEFMRMENIQIQAWGPLARGLFTGAPLENQPDHIKDTAALVAELAEEKDTSPEAIVLAWLMKHPACVQPVIGTVNPVRIKACAKAIDLSLTREEWYRLYLASRGRPLP
ncbi:aldo/keto reductase [Paenibacillus tarimensis]|uniref:aldo/keto reductase n=1 Tax=Paenibacillus tarimensis TaxID=416012 RepID=UPI001F1AF996|nr:aldo/keto reductase [Paenibacillus tarimensis]MCF2943956.1 aldo/keto reductase [Paenibacillus tarimensis]